MDDGTLVKTSFLLIALTIGVKLLGFAREQTIAMVFGAGPVTDAYYLGLNFALALISIVGGTFSTALVPVLTGLWEKQRPAGWRTMRAIGLAYATIALGVSAVVVAAAPWLVADLLGPGLPSATRPLAVLVLRVLGVGFPFWAMASVLAGVLNSRKAFVTAACAPLALSVSIVVSVFAAGRVLGLSALAVGTAVGMLAQFLVVAPFVASAWSREGSGAPPESGAFQRRVWALVGPVLGVSVLAQIPALIDKAVASGLPIGSVSVLSFAQKLMQLPIGLFVGGVATVFYTSLSGSWARRDKAGAANELGLAMGVTLLLAIPAAVGLATLSHPIVQFVFQHGRFDAAAASLTAHTLVYFCIGLPFVSVNLVLLRNAFAGQDVVPPLKGYAAALAVNAVGDLTLARIMGPAGIALASSLGAVTLALFLFVAWETSFRAAVARSLTNSLRIMLAASGLMGAIVLLISSHVVHRSIWIRLGVPGALGLIVYVLVLMITRPREVRFLVARARPSGGA